MKIGWRLETVGFRKDKSYGLPPKKLRVSSELNPWLFKKACQNNELFYELVLQRAFIRNFSSAHFLHVLCVSLSPF